MNILRVELNITSLEHSKHKTCFRMSSEPPLPIPQVVLGFGVEVLRIGVFVVDPVLFSTCDSQLHLLRASRDGAG